MKTYFKTFLLSTCAVALVTVSCKDNKDVAKADEVEEKFNLFSKMRKGEDSLGKLDESEKVGSHQLC